MQGASRRYLILTALLSVGALAFTAFPRAASPGPRAPTDELFAVEGWSSASAWAEGYGDTQFISRDYESAGGATAQFVIKASSAVKGVYRTGPEVPFLGNGYEVAPAPGLAPNIGGSGALVAFRSDDAYLILFAYGERRGLLGNGAAAWVAALFDGVLGAPNDYYQLVVLAPYSASDARGADDAVALAQTLFARTAAWYSS